MPIQAIWFRYQVLASKVGLKWYQMHWEAYCVLRPEGGDLKIENINQSHFLLFEYIFGMESNIYLKWHCNAPSQL